MIAKRGETLTALQALALLNNQFVLYMTERFAERIGDSEDDVSAQIGKAFRLAVAREPTHEEQRILTDYARQFGLKNACRVILNLNEFVFVD